MKGRTAAHAGAGLGHGLHHQRRFGDAQARAAIGLGNGHAQPARLGHGGVELVRKLAGAVVLEPVVLTKGGTGLQHGFANGLLLGGGFEGHGLGFVLISEYVF